MRIRHASQLHMAHFLVTKSEPRLVSGVNMHTPDPMDKVEADVIGARLVL